MFVNLAGEEGLCGQEVPLVRFFVGLGPYCEGEVVFWLSRAINACDMTSPLTLH